MGRPEINLLGKRFGRLTVVERASSQKYAWVTTCDCGTTGHVVSSNILRRGKSFSCGCLRVELRSNPSSFSIWERAARTHTLYKYKWQAQKRGLAWEISEQKFDELTQSNCHYCGAPPANCTRRKRRKSAPSVFIYTGIDRKDNGKGYTEDNVTPCCAICNRLKRALPYEKFTAYLDRVSSFRAKTVSQHA